MKPKVLCIGDTHMPWMDKKAFEKVLSICEDLQPDIIVQMGDLYDFFSAARWARSYDLVTPKQEFLEARLMAEEFWKLLQRAAPKAKCFQIQGNHDSRPLKKVLDKAPELASMLEIKHLWEFKNVKTIHDEREELLLEGICFMHGFRSKLGDHAKYNQMPTVCGHSHTGGVTFFPVRGQMIWELNAGFLGDADAVPLQYTRQKISKWTLGVGIIDHLGPRFVAF